MRNIRVSANKEKIILGTVTAVALCCVGIGLASVMYDSKNFDNNWNNVVDLDDGSYGEDVWEDIAENPDDGVTDEMPVSNDNLSATISDETDIASGAASGKDTASDSIGTNEVQQGTPDLNPSAQVEAGAGAFVDPLRAYAFSQTSALMWPVYGNVVMEYSMDSTILHKTLGVYKTNPSISISANVGDEVEAAASGIVQSVYESNETGNTLVIAVGDGYVTTYGLLKSIEVSEGEAVIAGQVLGTVGEPTAYYLEEGANVYFSVSKDGTPVDPMDFLVDR
jgi:murein DD-endopeptidase MepM/ murein hydrolase activator NlpD